MTIPQIPAAAKKLFTAKRKRRVVVVADPNLPQEAIEKPSISATIPSDTSVPERVPVPSSQGEVAKPISAGTGDAVGAVSPPCPPESPQPRRRARRFG